MADNWLTRRPIEYWEGTTVPKGGETPKQLVMQFADKYSSVEEAEKQVEQLEKRLTLYPSGKWPGGPWQEEYTGLLLQWWKDHLENVKRIHSQIS